MAHNNPQRSQNRVPLGKASAQEQTSRTRSVASFHDQLAKTFDPDIDGYFPLWLELDVLRRHCRPTDRVCDIGCANGSFAIRLAPHVASVTGVDVSYLMLKEAKRRVGSSNLEVTRASGIQLPFADASYDVSFSYSTLLYFNQPLDAIREMVRIVKSKGVVIVEIRNRYSLSTHHWDVWQKQHGNVGVSAMTWSGVRSGLSSLGLRIQEAYAFGAGDQTQFVPVLRNIVGHDFMHASKPPKPDLDYRLSNLPLFFRVAHAWVIVTIKQAEPKQPPNSLPCSN